MANSIARNNRKERIRKKVTGSTERPRLTVYKSLKHLHAQQTAMKQFDLKTMDAAANPCQCAGRRPGCGAEYSC